MPDGKILVIAALGAMAFYGGQAAYTGTRDHVAKPVYHHALQPIAGTAVKIFTLGHKHCCKPPAKSR